jgi:hypothetical protein
MTTDITNTETESMPAPLQIAEDFIKNNSVMEIAEEFVNHYNAIESLKKQLEYQQQETRNQRSRWASMAETIEEFLKSHIAEGDDASIDDLKELADSLDIELTKSITVKMRVDVEVEMTVPLDFDEDSLDEGNFDISAEFNGMTDVEVDDTNIQVDSFEVEED